MARQTWPCAKVIEASGQVVFLAIHRHFDTDWVVRMNVFGYPQLRFLDAHGRELLGSSEHAYARTEADILAAVAALRGRKPGDWAARKLPAVLAKVVPKNDVKLAESWDCEARIEVWRRLLPKCTAAQMAELFAWETDAAIRLEAARAMPVRTDDKASLRFARQALDDPNDYVREVGFQLLGKIGGPDAGAELAARIEGLLGGRLVYANTNNMLCLAVEKAGEVCEPILIEPLGEVFRRESANNSATHLAVASLAAIGRKHGKAKVNKALQLALSVDGDQAARLHEAARAAM
jgi:hypothetical protein